MSQNNFDKLKELASRDHLTAISIVPDYKGFPLFINREEASWHDFDALKTAHNMMPYLYAIVAAAGMIPETPSPAHGLSTPGFDMLKLAFDKFAEAEL